MVVLLVTPDDREKLKSWIKLSIENGRSVAGILSTMESGMRSLQSIATGEIKVLQLNSISEEDRTKIAERKKENADYRQGELESEAARAAAETFGKPVSVVGPYVFDDSVFNWACAEVSAGIEGGANILVLDEIGPLEARRGGGLASALQCCLRAPGAQESPAFEPAGPAVVLVVRHGVRAAVMERFGIPPAATTELDL